MPDKTTTEHSEQASYAGHRKRIRMRFHRNGFSGMSKHEVLEAMLILVIPRKDVKPLAKKLIAKYKTVSDVLAQPVETLAKFPGLGMTSAIGLKMFQACTEYCLEEKCVQTNLLDNSRKLQDFVRMKLGVKFHESYMLICLNSRNYLIDYSIIAEGTIDRVHNYSRNIVEKALECHACKVVLVHNHPSGDCIPSDDDIKCTYLCFAATHSAGVELVDHLIVSRSECFSFLDHNMALSANKDLGTYAK